MPGYLRDAALETGRALPGISGERASFPCGGKPAVRRLDTVGSSRFPLPFPEYIMGPGRMPPEDAVGRSILIVEDEKEIRDLLVHYLRREGFSPPGGPAGGAGGGGG